MDADLRGRAELVLNKLEELDPRFAVPPRREPGASDADPSALEPLLARSRDPDLAPEDRCAALRSVCAILQRHGARSTVVIQLAELGGQRDTPPAVRQAAAVALLHSRHAGFIDAFMARLGSSDPGVAAAAAHAMGLAKVTTSVPYLIELLARSPYPAVQVEAAWALGEIGDDSATEILQAAYRNGKVLVPVIEALGKIAPAEVIAELTVALRDTSPAVRLATAGALATLLVRHPQHDHLPLVPYLQVALENETDTSVALVMVAALHRAGGKVPRARLETLLGVDFAAASLKGGLSSLLRRTGPRAH